MCLSWVFGLPHGKEKGTFLALDLGGTNLRVCKITLHGDEPIDGAKHSLEQEKYKLPQEIKKSSANDLWNHVADALQKFMKDKGLDRKYDKDNPMSLGFTFSYPVTQHRIDHGILQRWTKGFDISGVEGKDVAAQLREKMEERGLPIKLIALANDTVGAMIASAYNDPETIIGSIFGTGCNAAYMQCLRRDPPTIPKLELTEKQWSIIDEATKMAINCEYGAFDNNHRVLPLTKYDEEVDRESPRPRQQTFEKLSAGLYLGEIFRLVLLELTEKGFIFNNQDTRTLKQEYSIDTSFLSQIEGDNTPGLKATRNEFKEVLGIEPTKPEIELSRRLAELIAWRGARLCACGVAALCLNNDIRSGHVAVDGSVAHRHPMFKKRWATALGAILDMDERDGEEGAPIQMTSAEDGSGVGVAVIAAMTMERRQTGNTIGLN